MNQVNKKARQRGALLLLCVLVSAGIVLIVTRTVQVKSLGLPVVQPIRVPHYFPGASNPGSTGGYNAKEEATIESFQQWMDSLQNTPVGKTLYDSICRMRPGLLDSAREAAHYYFLYHLLK